MLGKLHLVLFAASLLVLLMSSESFAQGGLPQQRSMFPNSPAIGQIHSAAPDSAFNTSYNAVYGTPVTGGYYGGGVGAVRVDGGAARATGVYRR
jgi:hypothetical protein